MRRVCCVISSLFCVISSLQQICWSSIRNTWYSVQRLNWDVTCGLFWPSRTNMQLNGLTGCWKWLVPLGEHKTVSGIRNRDGGYCCQAYALTARPRGTLLSLVTSETEKWRLADLVAVDFKSYSRLSPPSSPTCICLGFDFFDLWFSAGITKAKEKVANAPRCEMCWYIDLDLISAQFPEQ